jgi:hypothetical protein
MMLLTLYYPKYFYMIQHYLTQPYIMWQIRKLIGARIFSKNYEAQFGKLHPSNLTARDFVGHGTHTLSTAAGNFSPNVTIFGNGNGTAKGGSPRARVASYKVCWSKTDAGD